LDPSISLAPQPDLLEFFLQGELPKENQPGISQVGEDWDPNPKLYSSTAVTPMTAHSPSSSAKPIRLYQQRLSSSLGTVQLG